MYSGLNVNPQIRHIVTLSIDRNVFENLFVLLTGGVNLRCLLNFLLNCTFFGNIKCAASL